MDDLERDAMAVLRQYPRIYMACHVDHKNRKGQGSAVSARDQSILAHVPDSGVRQQALGAHLDLAPSTVSEALKRLHAMGLITLDADPDDARGKIVQLTAAGRVAIAETSVLNMGLVRDALSRVGAEGRAAIVRGLTLLADAAQAGRA